MNRVGFDKRIHPHRLQLRCCMAFDIQGIQNESSVTLNLQEGIITNYHTDSEQVSTTIREYIACDDELKELYSFLTLDAIEKFEAMPTSEICQYETGYYDELSSLRYLLISEGGRVSDGTRRRIYSNDPINMAIRWMFKTVPFKLDL